MNFVVNSITECSNARIAWIPRCKIVSRTCGQWCYIHTHIHTYEHTKLLGIISPASPTLDTFESKLTINSYIALKSVVLLNSKTRYKGKDNVEGSWPHSFQLSGCILKPAYICKLQQQVHVALHLLFSTVQANCFNSHCSWCIWSRCCQYWWLN